jgi:lysophospholipase L1-like esterase
MKLLGLLLMLGATVDGGAPPVRYLALGDSFTIGTGSSPEEAFPARLAARWSQAGRSVALLNLGRDGFSTDELIEVELPRVKAFAPTRVTLAVGANDIVRHPDPERYRAQLRRIFAALASAGVVASRVWCLPQPDWSQSPIASAFGDRGVMHQEIAQYNAILADEAKRAGATYVDLWPEMQAEAKAGLIASDGLHPSAQAHDAWAAALAMQGP